MDHLYKWSIVDQYLKLYKYYLNNSKVVQNRIFIQLSSIFLYLYYI